MRRITFILCCVCVVSLVGCTASKHNQSRPKYTYMMGDVIKVGELEITVLDELPTKGNGWSGPRYKCLVQRNGDQGQLRELLELELTDMLKKGQITRRARVPEILKQREPPEKNRLRMRMQ